MPEDDSEEEWRFSVDEFDDASGAGGDPSDGDAPDDSESRGENDDGNVAGEFSPAVPVVPEMPALENAAFVTLGVILTVVAFAMAILGPSFGVFDALLIVVIVGALGALAYGVFVRLTPDT